MKLNIISVLCVLQVGATLAEEGSTNAVLAATSQSGIVSVGPIVVTNGCSINLAADQSVWKVELTAEVNKAKFELAEENRKWMHTIQNGIEKMSKDAAVDAKSRIAQEFLVLKSDVTNWYDELKDILDVRLNIFTWVIGILVALFGVVAPVVMEVLRGKDYGRLRTELREDMKNMQNEFAVEKKIIDDAKEKWQTKMADVAKTEANFLVLRNNLEQDQKSLDRSLRSLEGEMISRKDEFKILNSALEEQQKALSDAETCRRNEYDKFKKDFERSGANYRGLSALIWADMNYSRGNIEEAMMIYPIALGLFTKARNKQNVRFIIRQMTKIDKELRRDNTLFDKIKGHLATRLSWPVNFDDIKNVLGKEKDVDALAKMFEVVYETYGKLKDGK